MPRRVVVGGSGDQARADDPEQVTPLVAWLAGAFWLLSLGLWLTWRRSV